MAKKRKKRRSLGRVAVAYRNPASAIAECARRGAESPGDLYACALRFKPEHRGEVWAANAKRLAREKGTLGYVRRRSLGAPREPLTQKELDWRAKFNEDTESTELSTEMSRLYSVKPRPLAKMYGSRGPTPEQRTEWEATNRQYNRLMGWLRKAHKVALERSNAAYRARGGMGSARAKAPFVFGDRVVSDYRVAPFLSDEVLTVEEVKNLGTQKKPHWRVKVSSPRSAEGWLDSSTLSLA